MPVPLGGAGTRMVPPSTLDPRGATLGNGYLGSRIDEERSEMRCLV